MVKWPRWKLCLKHFKPMQWKVVLHGDVTWGMCMLAGKSHMLWKWEANPLFTIILKCCKAAGCSNTYNTGVSLSLSWRYAVCKKKKGKRTYDKCNWFVCLSLLLSARKLRDLKIQTSERVVSTTRLSNAAKTGLVLLQIDSTGQDRHKYYTLC